MQDLTGSDRAFRLAAWSGLLLALAGVPEALGPPVAAFVMVSPRQAMNRSYNPLHLVGTYGAFGSISRERYKIVLEGLAEGADEDGGEWRAYEFKAKPGDPRRLPPLVAPCHLRLDWLMWLAALRARSSISTASRPLPSARRLVAALVGRGAYLPPVDLHADGTGLSRGADQASPLNSVARLSVFSIFLM